MRCRHYGQHHLPNVGFRPCSVTFLSVLIILRCWDGVNLDSADHKSHVAYPSSGSAQSSYECPSTHPVKIPEVFYEVVWDTTGFNDKSIWPEDGSQPFVWSYGDL